MMPYHLGPAPHVARYAAPQRGLHPFFCYES